MMKTEHFSGGSARPRRSFFHLFNYRWRRSEWSLRPERYFHSCEKSISDSRKIYKIDRRSNRGSGRANKGRHLLRIEMYAKRRLSWTVPRPRISPSGRRTVAFVRFRSRRRCFVKELSRLVHDWTSFEVGAQVKHIAFLLLTVTGHGIDSWNFCRKQG